MTKLEKNDRTTGSLVLLLLILSLYPVKTIIKEPTPTILSCDRYSFVQIEGSVVRQGVYAFCQDPGLMQIIHAAGGLRVAAPLMAALKEYTFPTGTKVILQFDGGGFNIDREAMSGFKKLTLALPISLNQESAEGFTAVPGIGPALAAALVKERAKRGGFRSLDEIRGIPGIGRRAYEKIKPYVVL